MVAGPATRIRGLLLERGITLRKGRHHVHAALPLALEDADANLSGAVRLLLTQLKLDLDQLSVRIDEADAVIQKTAHENEACRRLVAITGIGPVTATALIAAIGNGGALPQGAGVRSVDGGGSARTLHRWPAEAARYQQTWELLLAKTVRARRTCGPATTHEAVFRSESVVGTAHIAHAPQRRRRSVS
jgi:transposase